MALDIIFLDGAGAGGGGAVDTLDFGNSATGGDGGDGGSGADNYSGSLNDEVIMGDGAGGGGGDGDADNLSFGPGGDKGEAGNGADVIDGGAGDDIIFGDAYDGADGENDGAIGNPGSEGALGGFLGGGQGGAGQAGVFNPATDGDDSLTGEIGGESGDPGSAGESGSTDTTVLADQATIYNEVETNLESITSLSYSSSEYGTTSAGEGAGADTLDGGAGNDHLIGNGGGDSFITDMRDDDGTTDTIWDYDGPEGDTITIIDESGASIAIDTLYTPDANAATTGTENVGDDGVVYLADGSQLVIKNFQFQNEAPCFVTGTLINTAEGQKAIESLSIGDSVCTTDGQLETIKWIGKRAVAARFAGSHSQPICIQAGALAQGSPARDLYISPDHALFIDGVLVQAQALVNGSTITQVEMTADFTYYHIELDRHALIFAEGAETETFVDAQARGKFDNAAEFEALYPTAKAVAAMPYPRVKAKRQLPAAIKAKLKQVKTA